jgi:hypothetical protein
MRYKIEKEVEKETKTFLLFPRYCGKCKMAFVWEMVISKFDSLGYESAFCPICNRQLWRIKSSALEFSN